MSNYIIRCVSGRFPTDVVAGDRFFRCRSGRFSTEVRARDQAIRQWALGFIYPIINGRARLLRGLKISGNSNRIRIIGVSKS